MPNHDGMSFGLLLAFDTDDAEFARGFEAGRIWAALQLQPNEPQQVIVHASNTEMALRMAEATDRPVQGKESDAHHGALSPPRPRRADRLRGGAALRAVCRDRGPEG